MREVTLDCSPRSMRVRTGGSIWGEVRVGSLSSPNGPITGKVNWSAIGAVPPTQAHEFAETLHAVAQVVQRLDAMLTQLRIDDPSLTDVVEHALLMIIDQDRGHTPMVGAVRVAAITYDDHSRGWLDWNPRSGLTQSRTEAAT